MKIAIASGKGGTGKTTVALALAEMLDGRGWLLDCDVEAPNCRLFFGGTVIDSRPVTTLVPAWDAGRCDGCGDCAAFCRFHALAALGPKVLIFPELCHGCGGCAMVCKRGALHDVSREIGMLEIRECAGRTLVTGTMNIGETQAPALIRAVRAHCRNDRINILDAPPGTSCAMVAAVRDCDFVLLVTEPTPFGLHDFRLAVAVLKQLHLPCAAIINRDDGDAEELEQFCRREAVPVWMKIPYSRRIAEGYSRGEGILRSMPALRADFSTVLRRICGKGD